MGITSRLILSFTFLLLAASAFAKEAPFHYSNPIEFTADVVPRRIGVGEDSTRSLRFESWVALNERTRIGLTTEGQIFGAVEVEKMNEEGRTVRKNFAYLLSGRRKITEFSIAQDEKLRALDAHGRPLIFDDELWMKSPVRPILARTARNLADELVALLGVYLMSRDFVLENLDLGTTPTLILAGMAAGGLGMIEAWKAIVHFGDQGQFPDGFRVITSDDILSTSPHQKLYDRTCELELMPWPVDQSTWKP